MSRVRLDSVSTWTLSGMIGDTLSSGVLVAALALCVTRSTCWRWGGIVH